MTTRETESPLDRFRRVRALKNLLLALGILGALSAAAWVVASAGVSQNPLSVPLDRALPILLVAVVALSGLALLFRAWELRHAPKDGRKFLLAESSWRGAKRALGVALVLAVFFAIPAANDLVENVLSPTHRRTLDAGESLPVAFRNQDPLGLTKAGSLRVSVQTGTLQVQVANGTQVINPGGTILGAGEQAAIALPTTTPVTYSATFENAANTTTMFTYRVDVGFPPGFPTLVFLLAATAAGVNLVWLLHLRRVRATLPKPAATPQPVAPAVPRAAPRPPGAAPWFQFQRPWRPLTQAMRPRRRAVAPQQTAPQPQPRPQPAQPAQAPPTPQPPPPPSPKASVEEVAAPPKETPPETKPEEAPPEVPPVDIAQLMDTAEGQLSTGEHQEALRKIETVLRIDKGNVRALLIKAELLRRLGKPAEAITHLDRALSLDQWQHKALLTKAHLLEEQGRHDEALECYEAIIKGGPEFVEAFVRKGEIMVRMNEPELAIEAYQDAVRLRPGDATLEERIQALEEEKKDPLDRAQTEVTLGNLKEAEPLFLRALEGPRASEARRGLIDLYMAGGREEEGLTLLAEALQETPHDVDLLLRRIRGLTQTGNIGAALDACKAASKVAPAHPALWAIRGALEADLGHATEARESLRKAVELDPNDAESAKRLRSLRRNQDDRTELQERLEGVQGVPKKAVTAIVAAFSSLKELKGAQVKTLADLDGVSETAAKKVLRAVRKGG